MRLLTLISIFTALAFNLSFGQETVLDENPNISLKTVFIGNRQFLVADNWNPLPIDEVNREDMNSPKFGGKFYPMSSSRGLNEKRISIANQNMEVWVDVLNQTKKVWKLHSVGIELLNTFELDVLEGVEEGLWRNYTSRLNQYSPKIRIGKGDKSNIEEKSLKSVFIEPIGGKTDNRFAIRIQNDLKEPIEGHVYQFEIFIVFVNTENIEEIIKVRADKHYFLGFKK